MSMPPTRSQSATLDYGIAPPNYRLPNDTRLGRVKLQVAELERSLAYYRRTLGLRVVEQRDGRAVRGAQDDRPLVELSERDGGRAEPGCSGRECRRGP